MTYRGWSIIEHPTNPPTGRWQAESFGVILNANTEAEARRLVDLRYEQYPPDGHNGPVSRHLGWLVAELSGLFATDFLGALLLSHRIGREARRETERLTALPLTEPMDIEARDIEIRHLHSYIGYGT